MEHADDNSDSEKEFDQNELEVALYSQIHFDSSNDNEATFGIQESYPRASRLFSIGVKELPTRITINVKKPVFGGEFISFSNDKCESFEEARISESQGSTFHQEKDETAATEPAVVESRKDKSKIGDFSKLKDATPQRNDRLNYDAFKKNETYHGSSDSKLTTDIMKTLEVKTTLLDHGKDAKENSLSSIFHTVSKINEVQSDGRKRKTLAKEEKNTSTPKVTNKTKVAEEKLKETLHPFSVTKAPIKPKVTQTENILMNKPIKHTSSESVEKRKVLNPSKKNLAKLEGFLKLSKSERDSSVTKSKKRASLTKTDAAVKPRKPAVCLRRPPTVAVKYRQDSDTNTDYSDSDVSLNTSSPLKVRQNSLKDSSPKVPSSNENLASKTVRIANSIYNIAQDVSAGRSPRQVSAGYNEISQDKVVGETQENVASHSTDVNISSEDEDENSETDEESAEFEEEQGSINQIRSTSDIEDSESSDPEDFLTEIIPGLEFNLDKGVEALAAISESGSDNWKITDKDRHNIIGTLTRYFAPRVIQCRNCKADGHMSRDCPKPLKRRCIFCGVEGHSHQACPDAICFNCNAPGHKLTDCKERKKRWGTECGRCWMPGHEEEHCPDRWRQYHITVNTEESHPEADDKNVKNPLVFCYNCGGKGHLGFECKLPRMNRFLIATYPFIARYDTKNKCKAMKPSKRDEGSSKTQEYGTDDQSRHLEDKKIKRRHEHNKSVRSEDSNAYHKKHNRHDNEEEHEYGARKRRKRRSNQQRKMARMTDFKSGGSRNEGNTCAVTFQRDHNSNSAGQKRKLAEDDILNDYDNHQVKDNEWWERNDKPRKVKRQASSPNIGNDWRKDRQKQRGVPLRDDSISFQRNQTHRVDNNTQKSRGEWQTNRQQQPFQEKHGHRVFSPEFSWKQNKDHSYRSSVPRPRAERQDGRFSNYMQNHEPNEIGNKTFNQTKLQHAASWPSFQKGRSNLPSNRNGFIARNDRFVAMKKNCDLTVSIRK